MTETIKTLLQPIQNRVDDAEAKRARSRAKPDPIWDASMILAIQASSADVPKLLAAVQAVSDLADAWQARGDHLLEYSMQAPEEVSESLADTGSDFISNARLLRAELVKALTEAR